MTDVWDETCGTCALRRTLYRKDGSELHCCETDSGLMEVDVDDRACALHEKED